MAIENTSRKSGESGNILVMNEGLNPLPGFNFFIRVERHFGTVFVGIADDLHFVFRLTAVVALEINMAVAADFHFHRFGKGVGMSQFGIDQINDVHLERLDFYADANDIFKDVAIPFATM